MRNLVIFFATLSILLIPAGSSFVLAADQSVEDQVTERLSLAECRDPFTVFSSITSIGSGNPITKPSEGIGAIECLSLGVINFLLEIAIFVAAILTALSGIKIMTSGGNPKTHESATKSLQASLVGFALLFFIFGILNFVLAFIEFGAFQSRL